MTSEAKFNRYTPEPALRRSSDKTSYMRRFSAARSIRARPQLVFLIITLMLPAAAFGRATNPVFANVSDYGYCWWPEGPAAQVYAIQTSRYALWFNVTNLSPVAFFPLTHPPPESVALTDSAAGGFPPQPAVGFACKVVANGATNAVTAAGADFRDAQLVECGKFFQRRWHKLGLPGGPELNTNQSGLEIAAWPDRVSFVLRIVPAKAISGGALEMRLKLANLYHTLLTNGAGSALQATDGTGFAFLKSSGSSSWRPRLPLTVGPSFPSLLKPLTALLQSLIAAPR